MSNKHTSNAQKRQVREGARKVLSIILSLAMVLQTSPVAYARMDDGSAVPEETPVVTDTVEETNPVEEEVPTEEPVADEQAPADQGETAGDSTTTPEPQPTDVVTTTEPAPVEEVVTVVEEVVQQEEPQQAAKVNVSVYAENATIVVGGQTFANAQGSVSVPEDQELSFTVTPADGYELKEKSVVLSVAGQQSNLGIEGQYTITTDQLKAGVAIAAFGEKIPTKTEYVYEDANMRVVAKLDDPRAIPDDAILFVNGVFENSRYYNYDAYMDALNNSVEGENVYDSENTLLYDVAFLYMNEAGETIELQPEQGAVTVSFEFKRGQLSNGIDAGSATNVEVTHLPLVDGAKANTTYESTGIGAGDVVVEPMGTNVQGDNAVEVKTDTFSVFAFSYTVDFTYDGFTFSMAGESEILLSEIFAQLGIN
ncbi:MAG: hypothetical protein Q4C09_07805, partial [Atopobiaceae bacterium]|nr:hypothetical protein [Atopobiaceae bacterium]